MNSFKNFFIRYHYDWTQKVYDLEYFNEIPIDVKNMCELISKLTNFDKFVAQAGIVNYYHLNSTLSAHQDVAVSFILPTISPIILNFIYLY